MTALGFFASLPGICRVNPYLYLICPVQYAGYYDLLEDKIRYGTILLLCHGAEHSCLLRSVFFGTAEAEILPAGNEGAVAFKHVGKALFEVFKFLGVKDIAYNQPASLPYPTENPFA